MRGGSILQRAALAAALVGAPAAAHAQAEGSANVVLLEETRVTKTADLDFGAIIAGNGGGTIAVAPGGAVTVDGTVITLGGTQPAAFVMERQIFVDYPVLVSPRFSDTIEIVHADDADTAMTVRDFTTDFNRTIIFGLPAYFFQSRFPFRIGATLDVEADQKPGSYTGAFIVELDYE